MEQRTVETVPCATLTELLRMHPNVTKIDWFSLDVEGSELEALLSFDWSVPLHVLTIERNVHLDAIDALLTAKGFTYLLEYEANSYWANSTWLRTHRPHPSALPRVH